MKTRLYTDSYPQHSLTIEPVLVPLQTNWLWIQVLLQLLFHHSFFDIIVCRVAINLFVNLFVMQMGMHSNA